MGVDTNLVLPFGIQIRDIGLVCAALLGKKKQWYDDELKDYTKIPTKTGWVEIDGIKFQTQNNSPGDITINITGIGNQWWLFLLYDNEDGPYMSGRATAERICFHVRMAQFFGGKVIFEDWSEKPKTYQRKPASFVRKTNKDKYFHQFHLAVWNLKPITQKEIDKFEQYASYKKT